MLKAAAVQKVSKCACCATISHDTIIFHQRVNRTESPFENEDNTNTKLNIKVKLRQKAAGE